MSVNIRAIIFDLDDTLVAFDAVTEISWEQVCDEYCKRHSLRDKNSVLSAIKEYSTWYWSDPERHRIGRNDIEQARRHIVKTAFEKLSLPEEDAISVADRYSRVRIDNMYLLDGVEELLSALKNAGILLAVLTNGDSKSQRTKLERFGLDKRFDVVLIEGEVGFGKPDTRAYTNALERLGTRAGETIMVGDNPEWDVLGPQKAGMRGIWYDWRNKGLSAIAMIRPFAIIHKPIELLGVIGIR